MNTTAPQWYAVYTKPKWEKKVAEILTRKHIHHYCPMNGVLNQWHDKKKWVDEPLFTSYVFVFITPEQMAEVRKTAGVLNFVYWFSEPVTVRGEDIEQIEAFVGAHRSVKVEKMPIQPHDRVRIMSIPLPLQVGNVSEVCNETVKLLLPALGYTLAVTVEKEHAEFVSTSKRRLVLSEA
jgi:transcription antitermination factor NusG